MRSSWLLMLVMLLPLTTFARPELRVAVATNFKPTLEKLLVAYQHEYQEQRRLPQIHVSAASTGILYAQISHGAPFDLFFAADSQSVERLQQQLSLSPQRTFVYAIGQLVFQCRQPAPASMTELQHWQGRFAQANPKLAPYGRASSEVVERLGWNQRNAMVTAANVAQVSHYLHSGAIDCGFTSRSLVPEHTPSTHFLVIPTRFHQPISQKAIQLDQPNQPGPELAHFIRFIRGQGQQLVVDAGYAPFEQAYER